VTFNVRYAGEQDAGEHHWSNRRGAVVAAIAAADVDVACLQEALAGQYEYILSSLNASGGSSSEWAGVFVGRDDGARAGESAAILYRPARVALVSSRTFWLSDTPTVEGSVSPGWGNVLPRICTSAVFSVRGGGGGGGATVAVFNTHLDNIAKVARQRGLALIMAAVPAETPSVLCGDMNAPAAKEADTLAIATARLTDVVAGAGAGGNVTFHGDGFAGEPGRRIDYILASAGARAYDIAVDSARYPGASGAAVYPSDHYPVVASLEWDVCGSLARGATESCCTAVLC
jgi:endonuclease/exonuclease/phosphatase family metal-dependent hydrolase